MSIDAVTNVSSDAGAPMAGAVDPASARRISELGSSAQVQGQMQRLDGPEPQPLGEVKPFAPEGQPAAEGEAEPTEMVNLAEEEAAPAVDPNAPTPEQLAAEYQEFLDSPEIDTEKHGDKVIWYDSDGKGQMVPIRLKDVPQNILMYNDYQRKTTEVAEYRRAVERRENGQKAFLADLNSPDGEVQLRAARTMMNPQGLEKFVLNYVSERARIEKLDPATQQQLLSAQRIADENYFLKRKQENFERQQQLQQQQQQQELGSAAPDIKFVQDTILEALPQTVKQLGISDEEFNSSAFQTILDQVFTAAATGERNPDGSWKSAPTIQRGRAPSKQHIAQLVAHAKQRVDALFASPHARRLAAPRKVATNAPATGSGPSPTPGQRGNLSAPERKRWSDMGRRG